MSNWLQVLLTEKFFNACITHKATKNNENKIYCLNCCISLCPHCLSSHGSHKLLMIRRYDYHNVIGLDDAAKFIDCSGIQLFKTNGAKVIFLHQKPQRGKGKGNFRSSSNLCKTCEISLQDQYHFCSLSCKALSNSGLGDSLRTPNFVLEPANSNHTLSGLGGYSGVDCRTTIARTATTEVVRKHRRKGTPQRAPLY